MANVPFTGNYEDLSTDRGYQFKFYCEKCHNGYMSSFQTSKMGMLGAAARVAGSLFGGVFGRVARQRVRSAARRSADRAHDSALKDAVERDRADLQAVHALRQLGLRADLLEQEGRPLRDLRARSRRRDGRRAGRGRARTDAESAHRRLHEPARRPQPAAAVCPSAARRRRAASSATNAARRCSPKRGCAECGNEAEGTPKFCPECGTSYGP